MAQTFYWYDLETSGTDPRWDRIIQFAGLRTDAELNEIDEGLASYVQLPDDVLPNPESALVTGISPQRTHSEGITEWQALTRIHAQFAVPGTCVAGYNSLRFDDEFVRYGLYRGLMDPYAREWQNGNSRWDIIDLVRATGALRRDGIEWPVDEAGLPVYRLEKLSAANGLEHGHAHDAMSDVRATVALARLIRQQQPRLFEYYLGCRNKKQVRALLEPFGQRLCVHVSGMYPRDRFGVAPIVSVCRHPGNSNSVIVADLSQDIEALLEGSPEQIREELYRRRSDAGGRAERPPLKEIRINRCPFVAGLEVLTDENWSRLGLDRRAILERQRRLQKPGIAQKLARVFAPRRHEPPADVEAALYDGFFEDPDRARCQSLQASLHAGDWTDLDYQDRRLITLAARLKARSFPQWLTAEEQTGWREFVRDKLGATQGPWLTLADFNARLDALQAGSAGAPGSAPLTPDRRQLLAELRTHGARLAAEYQLDGSA